MEFQNKNNNEISDSKKSDQKYKGSRSTQVIHIEQCLA